MVVVFCASLPVYAIPLAKAASLPGLPFAQQLQLNAAAVAAAEAVQRAVAASRWSAAAEVAVLRTELEGSAAAERSRRERELSEVSV